MTGDRTDDTDTTTHTSVNEDVDVHTDGYDINSTTFDDDATKRITNNIPTTSDTPAIFT